MAEGNEETPPAVVGTEAGKSGALKSIISALVSNPIKTATSVVFLVGFCFQLVFWASINDMPHLNFEELGMVFAASAPVGLLLLTFVVFPFFVPAIAWLAVRDEMVRAIRQVEEHLQPAGAPIDRAAEMMWSRIIVAAFAGGIFTVSAIFLRAVVPRWISNDAFLLATFCAGPVCVYAVVIARYRKIKVIQDGVAALLLLGIAVGLGGSMVALPVATIAKLVGRDSAIDPWMQIVVLVADSILSLAGSLMLAWRKLEIRQYVAVCAAVIFTSFVAILVPLNVHEYVAQGIARILGIGALPQERLAVTEEECQLIRALSFDGACVINEGGAVTVSLTVLNDQGDSWFVEFMNDKNTSPDKDGLVYQIHVPSESIKGTVRNRQRPSLLIDQAKSPNPDSTHAK